MIDASALFHQAVDLIPEAWHVDFEHDAHEQGFESAGYTSAAGGLRNATIRRVLDHFAARAGDRDWGSMSHGQQLDECFPEYDGIGSFELLDELGIVSVYVCRTPAT